ncbi:methionine-R-sulfoxide reductase-like protein SelR [Xylariales sp. AK1849]|nr:methionine-R-sulfoxide reductase-like protein SelR [Xylariales sp. AK1849]
MRLPPFSSFIRTLCIVSSFTKARGSAHHSLHRFPTTSKFMPTIPFFGSLFSSSASSKMSYPDQRSNDEWRAVLNKEQFRILREKGTEPAGSGKYDKFFSENGVYTCAGCEAPLYKANHKFKSGCGWPAYFDNIPGAVTRHTDSSWGMARTEIVCTNCGGHLGHVFKGEGYATPTDERHCVNSVSLNFSPEDKSTKDSKA